MTVNPVGASFLSNKEVMVRASRAVPVSICSPPLAVGVGAQQPGPRPGQSGSQQPARDTPAQPKDAPPPPAGRITGRVLAADNGRPVKRARVFVTAAELPGGRGMLTDDSGVFDLTELPAGRYTLTVSKSGFVALSYGQRRPLQAGTPLQLADGQQLKGDRVPAAARQRRSAATCSTKTATRCRA